MKIIELLRDLLYKVRKTRDHKMVGFVSLVVSECEYVGKRDNREPTNDECLKVLKKIKAGIDECIKVEKDQEKIIGYEKESSWVGVIIDEFTPDQLTQNDIETVIKVFLGNNKEGSIGDLMKHFSSKFEKGAYEPRLVSETFKRLTSL